MFLPNFGRFCANFVLNSKTRTDPAIVGGLITGIVGLLAAVISRTRCFMRVLPSEAGNSYRWQAGCGFTEANIVPFDSRIETRVLADSEIIFARKTQ